MTPSSLRIRSILLIAALGLGAAACGSKGNKDSNQAPAAGTTGPKATASAAPAAPAAAAPAAVTAKKLPGLPLQADAADSWKIEADPVAPEGGARLSTSTGEVSVMKDGVGGVKKMTLADEKQQMTAGGEAASEVKEAQLADGWVLSWKTPGLLPYHATVYRNIGDGSYRCVITTEAAAQQAEGIAVCKSLRP